MSKRSESVSRPLKKAEFQKGRLAQVTRNGRRHDRWQHKLAGGARIWFYVEGQSVHLVEVHTRHPNETMA